ncbi:MAG: hypothetical protein PVG06_08965 [Desulfobacterales bacterium]|jgi:hypothetical protein
MANEYLVEIHKYISARIQSAENKKKTADTNNDLDSKQFYKGQLQEWFKIRSYLTKNLNPKLPGRIRKALEAKN